MLRHLRTFTPFIAGLIVLAVGFFFGEWLGLYNTIPHFDKALHIIGGVVAAWFALTLLQNEVTPMAAWKQVLIFVGITALIGIIWEWAEYVSNFTITAHPVWYRYFHGGDLSDTMGDFVSDLVGALLLSLWALRKERS